MNSFFVIPVEDSPTGTQPGGIMRKKTLGKKLTLKKETVANLLNTAMIDVKGGVAVAVPGSVWATECIQSCAACTNCSACDKSDADNGCVVVVDDPIAIDPIGIDPIGRG